MTYADPWQDWFEEERGTSDEFELELDADEVDFDDMSAEKDDY